MAIFINSDSKVIVQGMTGSEGTKHTGRMLKSGTKIVGGVTPGKGGTKHLDRPVFNTVADAVKTTGADVSIIFVPPAFAADATLNIALTLAAINKARTANAMIHLPNIFIFFLRMIMTQATSVASA